MIDAVFADGVAAGRTWTGTLAAREVR